MVKNEQFKFVMISAMYENGGNTAQRCLDGHPELYVYPFESQMGTSSVSDFLLSFFPFKYRWPVFPISGNYGSDFDLIYDEELKTKVRQPASSKFKDADLELNDVERKTIFLRLLKGKERCTANIVRAFFQATFQSWKNFRVMGKAHTYVGYSPIIVVDAEKIITDFPDAVIVHVIRNPYSAYADTKRRPFPLSLKQYALTWSIVQYMAAIHAKKFPKNIVLIKYEDLLKDRKRSFQQLSKKLGIRYSDSMLYPSWNGAKLEKVYPWGTIRFPMIDENKKAKDSLSRDEKKEIQVIASPMLKQFGYDEA